MIASMRDNLMPSINISAAYSMITGAINTQTAYNTAISAVNTQNHTANSISNSISNTMNLCQFNKVVQTYFN